MSLHTFSCIDGHTCGNPVRLVAGGAPPLQGADMLSRRAHFLRDYDWIRTGLMYEPRGHDMMSGAILYPPTRPDCEVAVLFIETSGCLPMCGHGTIGTITMGIENGLIVPRRPGTLSIETPAGKVDISYRQEGRFVEEVRLTNVPAFLYAQGLTAEVEGLGEIVVDVAYGGNFYAIVEPQRHFRDIADHSAGDLIGWSPRLRTALNRKYEFVHPELPQISGLSHILWTGAATQPGAHARNAVFYGDKAIDRSPCGTGTSARMAQLAARGQLHPGDEFWHESIIGSIFKGRVEAATTVAGLPAIVPSVAGWARMTGYNTIFIDSRDPFAHGFVVR
ncbi:MULTISPECIES: 4-hydroxyproline epimerase [unclassified Paracoccus (in: a-proteobacteria)]|uniref:4-hydroxyproline epimerase n=1 Tax=unclassified Paracoccus (in: a-proteobacteria) TaxID=2688777 RepID=UPI0012B37F9B|nr:MULTISPECIES: 4-hydroxyproline epimerase [unclassified Paracoccus (in: a-proteobacteria)]UXU76538.1 4-hydroxyproline epimerase [Paracoccus sp. SMMA_5]UXU82395.1 4-hydroxyproline epimerase [Paracoccus sp. SMMA_5_TC]